MDVNCGYCGISYYAYHQLFRIGSLLQIVGLELGMSYTVTHNLISPSWLASVIVSSRI